MAVASFHKDIATGSALPRWPLVGMVALALLSIAIAGFGRATGIGVTGVPDSPIASAIGLRFEDRDDGSVVVQDAAGTVLADFAAGTEGFIRGVMRALARDRKRVSLGPEQPFLLQRRENGRLSLSDPATGSRIELDAFGPGNAAAFARFLPSPGGRP